MWRAALWYGRRMRRGMEGVPFEHEAVWNLVYCGGVGEEPFE